MTMHRTPTDDECAEWVLRQMLADPRRRALPCCLCGGGPAYGIGVYLPPERLAKRLGERDGKRRFIGYTLCRDCAEEPNAAELVEEAIVRELTVQ